VDHLVRQTVYIIYIHIEYIYTQKKKKMNQLTLNALKYFYFMCYEKKCKKENCAIQLYKYMNINIQINKG
jgi:hypothetical protein